MTQLTAPQLFHQIPIEQLPARRHNFLTKEKLNKIIAKEGFKMHNMTVEDGFGEIALLADDQANARRTASYN